MALEPVAEARYDQHPPQRISASQALRDGILQAAFGAWLEATGKPLSVIPAAAPTSAVPGAD